MNKPFSITVTDVGPSICEMTHRKAACVRVEVSSPLDLKPKIIDRRRISDFFAKALGAAELFGSAIADPKKVTTDPNEPK